MKIRSLNIKNFKSIVDITINEPNPFTVFVGPNGCGKSNIFEALESMFLPTEVALDLVGGNINIKNRNHADEKVKIYIEFQLLENQYAEFEWSNYHDGYKLSQHLSAAPSFETKEELFEYTHKVYESLKNFSRIFIDKHNLVKLPYNSNRKLSLDCTNLELVLSRLLNIEIKEEIFDWLSLFIPEFEKIEIQKNEKSNSHDLLVTQKYYDEPFNKQFISDGTYNIIAILTAVFQSDEPQFLCIEEPENGLHPKVVKELANLFRDACDRGHYIWVNTHSQSLVSVLKPEEIILVNKSEGETKIKQVKDFNLHGFEMDEAWLSNALGGGLPW